MANRQVRNPGAIARFEASAVIGDAPSYAVNTGQASAALASAAGNLADTLGKMAVKAKVKERQEQGLTAGQEAYEAFSRQMQAGDSAVKSPAGPGLMVRAPGELRKIVSDAATKHGVDPEALMKIAMIESSFNPKAKNPKSSAGGLFQFIDSTAREYGLTDRYDPGQAADAAARLARDNAAHLRKVLGREPTAGELYLAHQQGRGGAAKLLRNPEAKAIEIVGAKAVKLNGGTSDMTAAQFANLWISKVGGGRATVDPIKTASTGKGSEPTRLTATPLALRRDGTIGGEAFDEAAFSAFSWRMQEGVSSELFAAQQQFDDDPEGYAAAAQQIRNKYVAELPNDPKLRELFDKSFVNQNAAFSRSVATKYEAKLLQEQQASFSAGYSSRLLDIERQAIVLGANPEGDEIIGEQVQAFQRSIDGAVAQGILSAPQAEDKKREIAEAAVRSRVQGVYEALPSPEEKEAFATDLLDEWKRQAEEGGPLQQLAFPQIKALSTTLFNDAREQINRRTAANKAERVRVEALIEDDVASIAASGKGLDPDASGLNEPHVREIAGEETVAKWQLARDRANRLYAATNGMEVQSTADLNQRLTLMKPEAGKPGYADELEIYDAARKRAAEVLKEREIDPLGQAARGGVIEIQPIDAQSSEELSRTLALRKTQRDQVAGLYQQPVPVFRPGEKEALATAIMRQPEMLPAFALSVRDAFGNEAPRVLAEISEDGPIIAHVAGLSLASGDNSVADDVAATLAMKREKVFTAKMPTQGEMSNFAAGEIAGALFADPRTQSAITHTAAILFEQMANQHGFDPNELKKEGSVARAAFARAIDRAAGGRTIGERAYGGLSEVNGSRIVVPADMEKRQPARLLGMITADQLEKLPPIDNHTGFDIPLSRIRQAKLVSAGDGIYRVALNDPLGEDPQFLTAPGGGFWTLDIRELDRVATETRTPAAPFGYLPWGGQ